MARPTTVREPPIRSPVLSALGAGLPAAMVFIAVLTIPLSAATDLGLSRAGLTGWILALYTLPGAFGLWLAMRYRQPLLLTGNVFAIILFASLAGQVAYADLVGASMLAGAVVAVLGAFGITGRLSRWMPSQVVLGLLAGAVVPFVVRVFGVMDGQPLVVGAAFIAYLVARRYVAAESTAVLPAVVVGLIVAAVSGNLGPLPSLAAPEIALVPPTISVGVVLTVTPVLVALMTLQANVPSAVFLRGQGYRHPDRAVDLVSGVGTIAASALGPTAVSIPLPVLPLLGGPDAGVPGGRFRAAVTAGVALVVIGLGFAVAEGLAEFVPPQLLLALAGLALFTVLTRTLLAVARGPLVVGPLLAFVVAQSDLSVGGLGPFFWALVIGVAASLLLEHDKLDQAHAS